MTELQDLDRPALENHARYLFRAAEACRDAAACVRLDRELWETGLYLASLRRERPAKRALSAFCPLAAREEAGVP